MNIEVDFENEGAFGFVSLGAQVSIAVMQWAADNGHSVTPCLHAVARHAQYLIAQAEITDDERAIIAIADEAFEQIDGLAKS